MVAWSGVVGTGHPDGDVLGAAALDGGQSARQPHRHSAAGRPSSRGPHGQLVDPPPPPDFWDRTLQNWQSEFLAIGAMAIFAVFLRQRGSPESKPVGAPHSETPQ
jgi:hypothetical protein